MIGLEHVSKLISQIQQYTFRLHIAFDRDCADLCIASIRLSCRHRCPTGGCHDNTTTNKVPPIDVHTQQALCDSAGEKSQRTYSRKTIVPMV